MTIKPSALRGKVNRMNMPGFTAERSLYKITGHYQSVATQSYNRVEQGVVSQMRAGGFGRSGRTILGFVWLR